MRMIERASEDLPLPDSPTSPNANPPLASEKETRSTARTGPSRSA